MACNDPCSNAQCPEHRIKHSVCNKPGCDICSTHNGPILCNEMHSPDGHVYLLTQREKDIASIVKFFHDKCKDSLLDIEKISDDLTEFPSVFLLALLNYIKKCSEGWTMCIHCLSETFPITIAHQFQKIAVDCGIYVAYSQFLVENELNSFIA